MRPQVVTQPLGQIEPVGVKSQGIRLLDVFAIGPLMIYAGWKLRLLPGDELPGLVLALCGFATILYNGHNYLEHQKGDR